MGGRVIAQHAVMEILHGMTTSACQVDPITIGDIWKLSLLSAYGYIKHLLLVTDNHNTCIFPTYMITEIAYCVNKYDMIRSPLYIIYLLIFDTS